MNHNEEQYPIGGIVGYYKKLSPKGKLITVCSIIVLFIVLTFAGKIFENVEAGEIVINQVPVTGTLEFWTEPGWEWQKFGDMSRYDKATQVWFSNKENQGDTADESIKIIFNDAGIAWISGSTRIVLPLDNDHLRLIQTEFGSMAALSNELILPTIMKVVFSSGPLMSSFESYAVKKNDLIRYIEDQLINGIYKTRQKETTKIDELSGKSKTVTIAELIPNNDCPGGYERQEVAPFGKYGIQIRAVSVEDIRYEDKIMRQIDQQQKALMDVQTAIAEAKKAKQDAIKAEEQGRANYQTAKWEQEKINAKEIAQAEKARDVAKLNKEKARYQKDADILEGQGKAAKKKLIMQADGALQQKLDAYKEVNKYYADAISKQKWVPETVISGNGSKGYHGAQDLVNLLMIKTARDLKLDPTPTQ